ncbi:hypothetical protein [Corynebacterium epidermidicanis]|uniref:Secreted protein n=1 Tax=Corynebacterium epidermidicanis TaxID=1050174 RepID=A0A0G3GT40_9CORY|nr:hypothetical protein [Corynebacterium epidermidicanis]AKK04346.1 hypothetical protein CEPID_12620 [Corynebacterium epidermidicanis]
MIRRVLLDARTSASCAVATVCAVVALSAAAPAEALPIPVSPSNPEVATLWNNPGLRPVDQQSGVVIGTKEISGDTLRLVITNMTLEKLHGIHVRVQRGEAVTNVADGAAALSGDQSNFAVATPFSSLDFELGPQQSGEFTLQLDRTQLKMDTPGVFPLLINVNGTLGEQGDAYLTSERLLFQTGQLPEKDAPMTLLLPVTTDTDVLPGEPGEAPNAPLLLLGSENLANQLGTGGRLSGLLDAYEQANYRGTCLAVDPEMVDTIDRMRAGYRVTSSRPNPVAPRQRLRDSWFSQNDTASGSEGSGTQAAARWIDQLRRIAKNGGCITALPWANTDLGAVARTGNQSLMNEAVARGNVVLSRVLESPTRSDVIIPGQGYLDRRTAQALAQASAQDPERSFEVGAEPGNWRALVAGNTVGGLADGISAIPFDPALGSLLAAVGDTPDTTGYSNQWQRIDPRVDSAVGRRTTAVSALALAASEGKPVVALPTYDLSVADAEALIEQSNVLFETKRARPIPLAEHAVADPGPTRELTAGSPYPNPSELTDTEVLRATQQARALDDITSLMTNDPAITLSRYDYTTPMRWDLLRALSVLGRRSMVTYDTATKRADTILNGNRDTQQRLRQSVALLPPGNVYTRTSASSPLLIVAQNGLPLPVDAKLGFAGPEGATINVPASLRIPARGSITTQMTADLPDSSTRTDLTVWLASQTGAQISQPVEIGVQTRSGLLLISGVVAAMFGLLGLLVFRQAKRRQSTRKS